MRIKRVEAVFQRVSSIAKPKTEEKEKKNKNKFKNVKLDNITIDGNSGDVNWEDFININNPNDADGDEDTNQQNKEDFTSEDL